MPTETIDIDLVPAREDHIPAMAALWAEAFPEKPAERRARELREGLTYGDLSDCWVVEVDGRLAGALRTYRLTCHFWGRAHPTMGLAGVAVAPDFRRRGIGRRMCAASLRIARERGDHLCALYPFRTSFYRDLGFVLAGSLHRYRFSPADLPLYPGWDRVVRSPGEGPRRARELYAQVAASSNGMLARTERMWSFLAQDGTHLYLHENLRGRATGYVVVRGHGGSHEKSRLWVKELVASDREAYLGLLGWLSVQRDQWGAVVYDALPGEDFHRRLRHPRTAGSGSPRGLWFHSATILRAPMLRILDLEAVLTPTDEATPGPPRAPVEHAEAAPGGVPVLDSLLVRDPILPDNHGRWDGRSRVDASLSADAGSVHSIGDVTALFAEGRLPGQPGPSAGWAANLGLTDYRLYDEF
jgi:predicted acetyltransferase